LKNKKALSKLIELFLNTHYFNSTEAPASSNLALISSASSLAAFSFTAPQLSAKSLASFKPKPVISLITLITAIFEAPALVNSTLKEDFSSSQPSPPAPATTATGAAADTPNFSSIALTKSFNSTIVKPSTNSIICSAFLLSSDIFN
jgi:hypothetical protein